MAIRNIFEKVENEISNLIESMGFAVPDCKLQERSGLIQVIITIYRSEGVSIDDCASVSRSILPELEELLQRDDISLEVSSPGMDRKIKTPKEFQVFTGSRIKFMTAERNEYEEAVIKKADDAGVTLTSKNKDLFFEYGFIKKARLDN